MKQCTQASSFLFLSKVKTKIWTNKKLFDPARKKKKVYMYVYLFLINLFFLIKEFIFQILKLTILSLKCDLIVFSSRHYSRLILETSEFRKESNFFVFMQRFLCNGVCFWNLFKKKMFILFIFWSGHFSNVFIIIVVFHASNNWTKNIKKE